MEIPVAAVFQVINVGAWLAVVPFLFNYLFGLEDDTQYKKDHKTFYGWGIMRYSFCVLWLNAASVFLLMSQDDWLTLCTLALENMTKIISGVFWSLFFFFLVYFFVRRYKKEKEKRGLCVAPPLPQAPTTAQAGN